MGRGTSREFKGTVDCILKTVQSGGLFRKTGVYQGFVVSCTGIMVYRGAYFGLYDTLAQTEMMHKAGFWGKLGLGYGVTVAAGETERGEEETERGDRRGRDRERR